MLVQQPLVPLLLLGPPFFLIILFGSTTLLTGMTGISLHMQWPQLHGSVSQREQMFFIIDQTPRPYPTRSLPAQFAGSATCKFKNLLCVHFIVQHNIVGHFALSQLGFRQENVAPSLSPLSVRVSTLIDVNYYAN
jgi:hypothetical protein